MKIRLTRSKLKILKWIYETLKRGEMAWKYDYPCYSAYMGYYGKHLKELRWAGYVEIVEVKNPETNRMKQALFLTDQAIEALKSRNLI
jgi:hypothetical protein